MNVVYLLVTLCAFHSHTMGLSSLKKKLTAIMPWPLKTYCIKNLREITPHRRVGLEYLIASERRQTSNTANEGEVRTKSKIYRMMYEMVRDSELKIRKAEELTQHWMTGKWSSQPFVKLGYLTATVEERYGVIKDIDASLKRTHHEWNAIEHVNAYEQVVNIALEIDGIIEIHDSAFKEYQEVLNRNAVKEAKNKLEQMNKQMPKKTFLLRHEISDADKMKILQNEIDHAIAKKDFKRVEELQRLRDRLGSPTEQTGRL